MIVDIILIILLVLGLLRGLKKGLVNMLVSFFCLIVAIILALILRTPITNMLVKTKMADNVSTFISTTLQDKAEYYKQEERKTNFYDNIIESVSKGESIEKVSKSATFLIFNVISFIIIFIVALIIGHIIKIVLNVVFDLPLLNSINKLGGGIIGLVSMLVKIFILFTIISFLSPIDFVHKVDNAIREGTVSNYLYENNIILNTIKSKIDI